MATFNIHLDQEKENPQPNARTKNIQGFKDKRPTLSVLNNITHGPRGQTGKVFREIKGNNAKSDENAGYAAVQIQQKKLIAKVPVEQFKTFSVYEDISADISKNAISEDNTAKANISTGTLRDPLKDISLREGLIETPMSIGDDLSPMILDKSQADADRKALIAITSQPRNDRDRFFDVEEYQEDILKYYREIEKQHRPKPTYMKRQPDINYSMRTILIDWLVEVAEEYRLHSETLYLAVSYIDRFLSYMSVVRAKLQLVGTAAMFVAAKYEEIYPPDVGEFVFITDDTYTKAQVLRMEQIILKILSFDLCVPTVLSFINAYAVLYEIPDQVKFLAIYISELSLLEGDPYLQYLPSEISSAALALARYILEFPIWCPELEVITSYSIDKLKDVILHLSRTHIASGKLAQQAIQEKYKSNKYLEVSTIPPIPLTNEGFDQIAVACKQRNQIPNKENVLSLEEAAENNENVRKMISSLIFV